MSQTEHSYSHLSPRREPPTSILGDRKSSARPASVTIDRPVAEVFSFVRDFSNFPKFMRGLKTAETIDAKRAHLTFDHESGAQTGDIERTAEETDRVVSWKTVGDAKLEHAGAISVEPAPGQRGTVVSLRMQYDHEQPSKVKGVLAYFMGHDPKNESYINLRRLKAYLETGEVPTIQGQPSGRDQ